MNIINNKNELEDIILIKGYLNGDNTCFNTLYSRYKRQLYSYLNKLLPGQAAFIDDIFQDTWQKIIKKLSVYEEEQKFLAWAMRIAHNSMIDAIRKNKRFCSMEESGFEQEEYSDSNNSPSQRMEGEELKSFYKKAIVQLSKEQKEVLLLRQDGISFDEISKILDCSVNTALSRMRYAMLSLKKIVKKMNIGDVL